ncbi:MAG: enoyl-CoA hydratase/isomerase family protein [Acidobacteria bacterium]|nr:enoyl-CoA hydratase/isomerase family protein [Acidobacteriota bacterium]
MEGEFQSIHLEIKNRLAHVTFNRPPLNQLSHELLGEVCEAMETITADRELAAVLFTAQGGGFSTGFDYSEHSREIGFSITERFRNLCSYLLGLDVVSIAVANGKVKNAACDLLWFFDVVIADSEALFVYDNFRTGNFPPLGTVFLPERLGEKRTFSLLLEGGQMSVDEAVKAGLVTCHVPRDQISAELKKWIGNLFGQSTPVLGVALRNLRRRRQWLFENFVEDAYSDYLNDLAETEDYAEGIAAWVEKRPPVWKNL